MFAVVGVSFISYINWNSNMPSFSNINGKPRITKYLKSKIWHEIDSNINKENVSKEMEIFNSNEKTHKKAFIDILRHMSADVVFTT